jgi:hypothetical protein
LGAEAADALLREVDSWGSSEFTRGYMAGYQVGYEAGLQRGSAIALDIFAPGS